MVGRGHVRSRARPADCLRDTPDGDAAVPGAVRSRRGERSGAAVSRRRASTRCGARGSPSRRATRRRATLYQAESRRSPPRTSMCFRWTPSNCAGSAARAARERSFSASVLNSTRRAPSVSNACRSMEVASPPTFAPGAPGAGCEPGPADLERARLRPDRQKRVEPSDSPRRRGDRRERRHRRVRKRIGDERRELVRVCGCRIDSQRQVRGSRDGLPEPLLVVGAQGLEHHDPPLQPLCDPLEHDVDTLLARPFAARPGPCLHSPGDADLRVRVHGAARPTSRSSSATTSRPATARTAAARTVRRQLSVFAAHGTAAAAELRRQWRRRLLRRKLWLRH